MFLYSASSVLANLSSTFGWVQLGSPPDAVMELHGRTFRGSILKNTCYTVQHKYKPVVRGMSGTFSNGPKGCHILVTVMIVTEWYLRNAHGNRYYSINVRVCEFFVEWNSIASMYLTRRSTVENISQKSD